MAFATSSGRLVQRTLLAGFAFLFLVLPSTVDAQQYLLLPTSGSSTFPACALKCNALQQAQDGCVPPRAQVTNDNTYVSCFCQSALITGLHTSPDVVCTSECPTSSDRTLLMQWYQNYCASGGKVVQVAPTTTATTTTASPSSSGAASAPASSAPSSSGHHGWWSTHYRWVIMVIVLVIGFGIIAAVGVWLKRRYEAKRPALYPAAGNGKSRRASSGVMYPSVRSSVASKAMSPPPVAQAEMWGPHQSMVHPQSSHSVPPGSVANNSRLDMTAAAAAAAAALKGPEPTVHKPVESSSDDISLAR